MTLREYYGYTPGGLMEKKTLHVTKWTGVTGQNPTGWATATLETTRQYDSEGRMISEQYPGGVLGAGPLSLLIRSVMTSASTHYLNSLAAHYHEQCDRDFPIQRDFYTP
jgi:hypothetical protein